ncbi:hypothetical protein [Paenibacillus silviterrae]|uniref:hypothetical protein n=1 Tax=Paenibacillus silviterrae TaxID=3242194 RepID=UPI0025437F7B|nr:hypothetical protein [Paenibacillus chinjuensis]
MNDQPQQDPKRTEDQEDLFLKERMERWGGGPRQESFDPFYRSSVKNKWIAGLLSFLVPGTGQLYLGLMHRGMTIMVLLILNIFAIVAFATNGATNIPLIVLFSLFIPVIYFFNIFDALQQTDKVNGLGYGTGSTDSLLTEDDHWSHKRHRRIHGKASFGYMLILVGIVLFLTSSKPDWMFRIFDLLGSSIGAIVLILIGVYMFFRESTKK